MVFRSRIASMLAVSILILCSIPIFSNKLITYLENEYILSDASSAKTADAIVVLSGMVRTINSKNGLSYEWGEASDRIFAGIELIKKNKAPIMILTGGKLPWSVGKPEGEYLRDIAIKYGVPNKNILLTKNVQNTDQEAKAVAKLLNKEIPNIILVTSAFHMPRAQKVFEAAGIVVSPFPVDFLSGADKTTLMHFIPSAGAFSNTSFFVREIIGRLYYKLKY
ncbi:YdcF family protein [Amylibacter sp.]|nr:YdcF family protein [Amylibacter sp.]